MTAFRPRCRGVTARLCLAALVLLPGLPSSAAAQPQPAPLRRSRLDIVFSSSLFRAANRNDATAAVRVWCSMIGRQRGFQFDPSIRVVDSAAEARRAVLSGSAGLLALDTVEFLGVADLAAVEPVFVALRGQSDLQSRYLVLVRREAGISSLEGLRGKSVLIHTNTGANLGAVWLNALLHDRRLGPAEGFFGAVQAVPMASSAILPVFFGKAGAAIVDQASFDVTKEMNPQVGARLQVLSASPQLAEGLLCICPGQVQHRAELIEGLRELDQDAAGRQILLVFRFSRLAPVDRLVLDQVRELWRKHQLLSGPPGPRGGTP